VSITKVVVFFTTNPTKFGLQFSEFLRISTYFTSFCNRGFTIEDPSFNLVLRIFYSLPDRSLVCAKHPAKRSGIAIGPLAMGGSGLAGNPAQKTVLLTGERRGVEHMLT
jgi:hypothetical protein